MKHKNYTIPNYLELKARMGKDIHTAYFAGDCIECDAVIGMNETHENVFLLADGGVYHVCDACLGLKNVHTAPLDIETTVAADLKGFLGGDEPVKAEPVIETKKPKKGEA